MFLNNFRPYLNMIGSTDCTFVPLSSKNWYYDGVFQKNKWDEMYQMIQNLQLG